MDQKRLRIEFTDKEDAVGDAGIFCRELAQAGIRHESPIENVVDILLDRIQGVEARHAYKLLRGTVDWRLAGPACPRYESHGLMGPSKGRDYQTDSWVCSTRLCMSEERLIDSRFVSMNEYQREYVRRPMMRGERATSIVVDDQVAALEYATEYAMRKQYRDELNAAPTPQARQAVKERNFGLMYGMRNGKGLPSMRHVLPPDTLRRTMSAPPIQGGSADFAAIVEKARKEWPGIQEYSQAEIDVADSVAYEMIQKRDAAARAGRRIVDQEIEARMKKDRHQFLAPTGTDVALPAAVDLQERLGDAGEELARLRPLVAEADRMVRFLAGLDTSRNTVKDQREKADIVYLVMRRLRSIDEDKDGE